MECKYCKSKNIKKQGLRKNTFGDIQKYYCNKCKRFFSTHDNFRMRYPKNIRALAIRLNEEKNSLRQISQLIYKKTHVKISQTTIMTWIKHKNKSYNYRYKKKCPICKIFITNKKEHICKKVPARKGNLYHCARCCQYLPKKEFHKDKTKRCGVMAICKKCRKPILHQRNIEKTILKKLKRLAEKFK